MKQAMKIHAAMAPAMTVAHFAISTRNAIQGSDLADGDKHALTEQIAAIDADGFIRQAYEQKEEEIEK